MKTDSADFAKFAGSSGRGRRQRNDVQEWARRVRRNGERNRCWGVNRGWVLLLLFAPFLLSQHLPRRAPDQACSNSDGGGGDGNSLILEGEFDGDLLLIADGGGARESMVAWLELLIVRLRRRLAEAIEEAGDERGDGFRATAVDDDEDVLALL